MRNAARTLPQCLRSLDGLDYPRSDFEVIFVDNGSTDNSKSLVETAGYPCLSESIPGACAALRRGIAESIGRYLAFTHADCVIDSQWLRAYDEALRLSDYDALAGSTEILTEDTALGRYLASTQGKFQSGAVCFGGGLLPWVNFVNAVIKRSALDGIGGLDPLFRQETELDCSFRLALRAAQFSCVPAAKVSHYARDSLSALWAQKFYIGRAWPRFVRKYGALYRAVYPAPYCEPLVFLRFVLERFATAGKAGIYGTRFECLEALLDVYVYLAFSCGAWREAVALLLGLVEAPTRFAVPDLVLEHESGDESLLLMHAQRADPWELQGSAKCMWKALQQSSDFTSALGAVIAAYPDAAPDELAEDLREFDAELQRAGLRKPW